MLAPGYRVLDLLSRGRDLDVYDVWSEERHCRCVAKVARPDRSRASVEQRLRNEATLLMDLTHPHLVRGYDLLDRPQTTVILETLTGFTLGALLADRPRLPLRDLANLGAQLAAALGYLHAKGWLHLDLKPDNVVAEGGKAKLIDLSLAQPPGPVAAGLGTTAYLSPEQARGEIVDVAADVWGLGLVLYEAATGVAPFSGVSTAVTSATPMHRTDDEEEYLQLSRVALPIRQHRRLVWDLAEVIDAALDPDPRARPTIAAVGAICDRHAVPPGVFPPSAVTGEYPPSSTWGRDGADLAGG